MFARDDETAALLKQATAASSIDLDSAIEMLRRAHERMRQSPVSWPVETWLRLPLYLQKAGHLDDALREIDFLESETEWRVNHACPQTTEARKAPIIRAERKIIAEKRALILKRAAKAGR